MSVVNLLYGLGLCVCLCQLGRWAWHTHTHVIIAVRCLMHKLKNFLILLLASLDVFFRLQAGPAKAKKVFLLPVVGVAKMPVCR